MESIVLMVYCIYCSGVFGWVNEWMDGSICIDGVLYIL